MRSGSVEPVVSAVCVSRGGFAARPSKIWEGKITTKTFVSQDSAKISNICLASCLASRVSFFGRAWPKMFTDFMTLNSLYFGHYFWLCVRRKHSIAHQSTDVAQTPLLRLVVAVLYNMLHYEQIHSKVKVYIKSTCTTCCTTCCERTPQEVELVQFGFFFGWGAFCT